MISVSVTCASCRSMPERPGHPRHRRLDPVGAGAGRQAQPTDAQHDAGPTDQLELVVVRVGGHDTMMSRRAHRRPVPISPVYCAATTRSSRSSSACSVARQPRQAGGDALVPQVRGDAASSAWPGGRQLDAASRAGRSGRAAGGRARPPRRRRPSRSPSAAPRRAPSASAPGRWADAAAGERPQEPQLPGGVGPAPRDGPRAGSRTAAPGARRKHRRPGSVFTRREATAGCEPAT